MCVCVCDTTQLVFNVSCVCVCVCVCVRVCGRVTYVRPKNNGILKSHNRNTTRLRRETQEGPFTLTDFTQICLYSVTVCDDRKQARSPPFPLEHPKLASCNGGTYSCKTRTYAIITDRLSVINVAVHVLALVHLFLENRTALTGARLGQQ